MYDALYEAWSKEKESLELQKLPENFYTEAAEYVRRIQRESRMLESKSVKAKLISEELARTKRMVKELIALRFDKLVGYVKSEGSLNKDALTSEEKSMALELKPSFEKFQAMLKDSVRGKVPEETKKTERTRSLLRFLSEVPAIVGTDLKVYGPFAVEDVATLPTENAKVLVKRGVAMEIETS